MQTIPIHMHDTARMLQKDNLKVKTATIIIINIHGKNKGIRVTHFRGVYIDV